MIDDHALGTSARRTLGIFFVTAYPSRKMWHVKVLGVAISSGAIYYGALDATDDSQAMEALFNAPERLTPAVGLTGAQRLADTYQRITQDIRILAPSMVVLVGTRKHGNWKYKDASERVSLVSALMLSCTHEDITFEEWTTERIGKLVGVPAQSLSSFRHEEIQFVERPRYWNHGRGQAFAAAAAYAIDQSGH